MIPYDDLVAALSSWRARQGLPVNTPGAGAPMLPGSGPSMAPPMEEATYDDPGETLDAAAVAEVDESAYVEEADAYDNSGDDFAMAFGQPDAAAAAPAAAEPEAYPQDYPQEYDGDATAIGAPPSAEGYEGGEPAEPTDPTGSRGPGHGDW